MLNSVTLHVAVLHFPWRVALTQAQLASQRPIASQLVALRVRLRDWAFVKVTWRTRNEVRSSEQWLINIMNILISLLFNIINTEN